MAVSIPSQHKRAAAFINALKPSAARQEIPDSAQAGLYLVMQPQPSGSLSWAVRTKVDGKPAKITLGRYDEEGTTEDRSGNVVISATQVLNTTQARALAERVIADAKRGHDPRQEKTGNKFSVDHWLDEFVKTARTAGFKGRPVKASTADEYERIIATNIKPNLKHVTDIRAIDYRDIEKLIAKLQAGAQRNAFAVLSAFFRWKAVARVIGRNIIELAEAPTKPQSRERVLSHDEIKTVWNAATKCGYPFGPMVQLLLLTGQRRDEIANLKWSEISDATDALTLEGSRTKNGRAHIVPLAPLAKTIIEGLPAITDADGELSAYVFTTTGKTPFSGFSNGKIALDKHCGEPALMNWHLHDLRRTCATELAKLGIKQEVTEAILNHKTGKVSGVAGIYNRYDYQDEKAEALKQWATRIASITANNVTLLPKRA
ncbi:MULTISPECIES: tyrosine-type recombinase/integrase [unclassified Mesorhizobium]|uniref:tyrosine-type recombinase/integrase n=1 Tax=unclassified Mesorhizobium TaxID=325217 RepID=UPI00333932F6